MSQFASTRAALIRAGTDTARHDGSASSPTAPPTWGLEHLLAVVGRCVLATRIIWELDAGGRLVLEAANRRVLRVCEVPPAQTGLAQPLFSRPLTGTDAGVVSQLVEACLAEAGARTLVTFPLDTVQQLTLGGPDPDAIAEAAGLGPVSAKPLEIMPLFERSRDRDGPPPLTLTCFGDGAQRPPVPATDASLADWAERALDVMLAETCPLATAIAAGGLVSLGFGAAEEDRVLFAFDDGLCNIAAAES
jgi:hypothetical protein